MEEQNTEVEPYEECVPMDSVQAYTEDNNSSGQLDNNSSLNEDSSSEDDDIEEFSGSSEHRMVVDKPCGSSSLARNRRFHIVDYETSSKLSSKSNAESKMDWGMCVVCQTNSKEQLQCPARSKKSSDGMENYTQFVDDLQEFSKLDKLPHSLSCWLVEDKESAVKNLVDKQATWHKLCRVKYSNTAIQRLHKRKKEMSKEDSQEERRTRSVTCTVHELKAMRCFFCDEDDLSANLNHATTFRLDGNVREAAMKTQDSKLLGKLSSGDLIALEAKYHHKCLIALYNRAKAVDNKGNKNTEQSSKILTQKSLAFSQLLSFIKECKDEDNTAPVFKLAELKQMYKERLNDAGINDAINSTQWKDKLLMHVPELRAEKQGRNILLAYSSDIGQALFSACAKDIQSDTNCLARAANIVREEMFTYAQTFEGTFSLGCEERSVPSMLLALVHMILEGPSINAQNGRECSRAAVSIAHLLKFNSVKHKRVKTCPTTTRHAIGQEVPLPIYVGLMTYSSTRKKKIVDKLFDLGLSVSYDRVSSLSSDLASSVCRYYKEADVVCPPYFSKGIFTTAAVDNIDHNYSSNTAKGSFHGTGISLFQHPTDNAQVPLSSINITATKASGSTKHVLPQWYVCVNPDASIGLQKNPVVKKKKSKNYVT